MTAAAQTALPDDAAQGLAHPAAAELLRGWIPEPVVASDRLGFWAGWFTGLTLLLGLAWSAGVGSQILLWGSAYLVLNLIALLLLQRSTAAMAAPVTAH